MIIYNDSRLVPTDVNMMVIRSKDNIGYVYIHRALLEQAVIIQDMYEDNLQMLIKAVTSKEESRADVDYFFENAPAPINYLAPFLLLVKSELDSMTDMYGALHVMSGQLNFRKMLKISPEMRSTPTFSLSIREEYQLAWDRFLQNAMPYDSDMLQRSVVPNSGSEPLPMNGTANDEAISEEDEYEKACIGADGKKYSSPLEAALLGCGDDIFDMPEDWTDDEDDEDSDKDNTPAPTATTEPASAPEPEPEPEPEPAKKLTGLDALLGGKL